MTHALKVMTFNIRHGRALDGKNRWYKRRDMVFDVIRSYSPHVLGLQEVDPFQLDELTDAFPTVGVIAHRRYGAPTRIGGAYTPILFDTDRFEPAQSGDFWLAPDPEGRRKRSWDAAVVRMCTWGVFRDRLSGDRIALFNTHFDQRGQQARRESAHLVVRRLEAVAHLPRLFIGDLNARETSEPIAILKQAGLRDTFRVVHPEGPAGTFHAFEGPRYERVRKLDYVLCDDRWKVCSAEIVRDTFPADAPPGDGRLPSDHYPLTADLELTGTADDSD